jgi:hypothetical protein
MSSDLIGGYLKLDLNRPMKWADFRLNPLLADTMLTKLYTTGPKCRKLSFIARTGLKYDRGMREYFKGCECNKGTFYTDVLQHFIYDQYFINNQSRLRITSSKQCFQQIVLLYSDSSVP